MECQPSFVRLEDPATNRTIALLIRMLVNISHLPLVDREGGRRRYLPALLLLSSTIRTHKCTRMATAAKTVLSDCLSGHSA